MCLLCGTNWVSISQKTACFIATAVKTSHLKFDIKQKTNSVALCPQANYTDWVTATCRRNLVPAFVDRRVSRGQLGGSPTVVNLSFLDHIPYFSFKWLLIYSHKGRVDPVPDALQLRKSGGAGNRTRDLWVSSQELWPLESDIRYVSALRIQIMSFSFDVQLHEWPMSFQPCCRHFEP
jgi:hypothetical protein